MALRRHRLPRFWLALTLGGVLAALGGAYWWERQLPQRLQEAERRGDLESCLRFSEQLAALSWLPGQTPVELGRCRRRRALQLWSAGQRAEALALLRQLLDSPDGNDRDRGQLSAWEDGLRQQAMQRFQAGDLKGALALLAVMGEERRPDGTALGDDFRQIWDRNRVQLERATRLRGQNRWWEALDALNRIDHPWWRNRSLATRRQVQQGIDRLRGADRDHDAHGALPHTVPMQRLDVAVQRRIAAGMDEWQAFQEACRELGGRVVEAGPDSSCQK